MACGTAPLYLQAAETTQAQTYRFDIAGQSLDGALAAFSAVTRVQVLVSGELTQGVLSPGVKGNFGQREALGQLLGGTGLSAAFINADTVTLEKRMDTGSAIEVGATTISAEHLGATTEGSGSYTTGAVTLGKGEQKLKDIPQSVSVMTRKQMDDQNTTKLSEVVKRTPGLTATKSPGPGMFIFSRGFEIGTLQYDGVGIPRNTYALGSYLTENMAIYDRVETLRGPAALLQGANSPGGTMEPGAQARPAGAYGDRHRQGRFVGSLWHPGGCGWSAERRRHVARPLCGGLRHHRFLCRLCRRLESDGLRGGGLRLHA